MNSNIAARLQLIEPWLVARSTLAQELMLEAIHDDVESEPPLRTPSALKASALGGGRVQVRWESTLDTRVRFIVQRWTAAKGWSDIAHVPGYRTSFIDERLTPYTTCALRVLAEDGSGRSQPSNVARISVR